MFRVFLEFAFVIIVIAWVLAEVLSAPGRWSGRHPNSKLAKDIDTEPAKHPDELDFGTLGLVLAVVLVFVLLVPSAVSVATISPANRPAASSTGVALLYSFLRGKGISAVLTAGVAMRSI